jgi:hypothetical protein
VIEALSLARQVSQNHRRSRRWSFYTASVLASSSYAREAQERHRLKSFGRDSVRDAADWLAMANACGCKVMDSTGGRCVV